MESDTEEVEIKIEYIENYETDPLSQKHENNTFSKHDKLLEMEETMGGTTDRIKYPENDQIKPSLKRDDCGGSIETSNNRKFIEDNCKFEYTWYRKLDSRGRYLCKFCTLSYLTTQTLRHHVKIKHSVQATTLENPVKHNVRHPKIKCHICKKCFKLVTDLTKHLEEHHKGDLKIACYICNASFIDLTEINNHLISKHNININLNRILYCHICGYRTLKTSHYKQHRLTHLNENAQKCEYCGYTTNRVANLKIHERTHTNQKPYSCNFESCDYKCSTKSGLESHKRKHSPEKNLIYCDRCSYKTIYKQSLKKHMNSHVNNSVKTPFC